MKDIGLDVKAPKKKCEDRKCPFHGSLKVHDKLFQGVVISKDTNRTATVEWNYRVFIPKYERHESRRTKIRVHNPPCVDAQLGEIVKVAHTRPLSKTKNCVIVCKVGVEKSFVEEMEAREEALEVIGKKERKKPVEEVSQDASS